MKTVGILAVMGSREEHAAQVRALGHAVRYLRSVADFEGVDALILPGGESTTIGDLAVKYGLMAEVRRCVERGVPVLGTCAGLILLAREKLLDVRIERNAYGTQKDSFETEVVIPLLGKKAFPVVCIRAPRIASVGKGAIVLASDAEGAALLVKQGNVWGASFHPELTADTRLLAAVLG